MAIKVDIEELFKAGAHFGHKANKWHPKMAPYIHSKRKGGHIINLERTVEALEVALPLITKTVQGGGEVLFVATKAHLKNPVKDVALATGSPYVVERWFGGMLTNRATMLDRIKRLKMLEAKMENGEFASRYSKLEVQRLQEELDGLEKQFGGIKEMKGLPSVAVIFDANSDMLAVNEASKMGVTVIAVCDSNVNPSNVDIVIPANDDATSGITLIAKYFEEAVKAGQNEVKTEVEK